MLKVSSRRTADGGRRMVFALPPMNPKEKRIARKLAQAYEAKAKTANPFCRPFRSGIPYEAQPTFTHFLNAARMCIEVGAEPRTWIAAQFSEMQKWKGDKFIPLATQLATPNASLRYAEYVGHRETVESKQVQQDDVQSEAYFAPEIRKARKLAATLGTTRKGAVKRMPREFTPAFVKHLGLWGKLRSHYED